MIETNTQINKHIVRMVCDKDEKEDIYYFILHCPAYKEERSHSTHLHQPYIESDEDILGHFLFGKEDMKKRKKCYLTYGRKTTSNENNKNVRLKSEIAIQLCLVMVKIL